MKASLAIKLILVICIISLSFINLPATSFAHDGGGGGGGGGGKDGASAAAQSGFGARGPSIKPIRGIENFPVIPAGHRGSFTGYVGMPNASSGNPNRKTNASKTPTQQLQALKSKFIRVVIEDLWKDKAAAVALAPVPPILAAYKAVDTLNKAFVLSVMAAVAIDLKAREFRAPYTKAAAGMLHSHPGGHSHPEGGYRMNPNTPTTYSGSGGTGTMFNRAVQPSFWN